MHFQKPALSISEQISLLRDRGLTISSAEVAENWLRSVSYYRLSGYWLPFEIPASKNQTRSKKFLKGTTFDDVTELYIFDRNLRLIIMEAIERIEIALRARWTYHLVDSLGSHAHLDPNNFDLSYREGIYWGMVSGLTKSLKRSDEVFINHYKKKYKTPSIPPLWAASELMTFGELSIWVAMTKDKKLVSQISKDLGFPNVKTFEGTLQNIALVRNKCAHHSRVWNRKFTKRVPSTKSLSKELVHSALKNSGQTDNRIYNTLVVLVHMLRIQAPTTTYPQRLIKFILSRPSGDQRDMGFPTEWTKSNFWQ